MFALGNGVFREMTKKHEYFVVLIGLDQAGKSVSRAKDPSGLLCLTPGRSMWDL